MRSTGRVRALLGVGAMLLSAGCGGGKASDVVEQKHGADADRATTTTTVPTSDVVAGGGAATGTKPADGARAAVTTTTAPAPGTPAAAGAKPSLTEPGPKGQLEVKASLAESCVRPGGRQSITILTRPDSAAGYDTVYSDGRSGITEGHYGGNGGGRVDESGSWSDTWVVSPHAPAGKVRVNVLAGHIDYGTAEATLFFAVADVTGNCP